VNCPICAAVLEGGELVMVCAGCHKSLGGGLSVNATGEFRVPTALELLADTGGVAEPHPSTAHGHAARPAVVGACAWCGKLENQVKKLLGRGGVALCNECVSLCCDILDAELGGTWR